jgi:hypothetical protein
VRVLLWSGGAVVALLIATAASLTLVHSLRGGTPKAPAVTISAVKPGTPSPSGVGASASAGATVRLAPSSASPPVAVLRRGVEVVADARTADSRWLRVVSAGGSPARGWIDAAELAPGNWQPLPVTTPESVVIGITTEFVPTATPTPTSAATPTSTATATPALPDLVPTSAHTGVSGTLVVTVADVGTGDVRGDLVVAVFDLPQTTVLGGFTLPGAALAAGQSVDVDTGYAMAGQAVVVVVNPNDTIAESDPTNNRLVVQPPATPTPGP